MHVESSIPANNSFVLVFFTYCIHFYSILFQILLCSPFYHPLHLLFIHFHKNFQYVIGGSFYRIRIIAQRKRPHFCGLSLLYPLSLPHLINNLFCYIHMYSTLTNPELFCRLPYCRIIFYDICCDFNGSFLNIIFHKYSPRHIFLQCMQGHDLICYIQKLLLLLSFSTYTSSVTCSCTEFFTGIF